MKQLLYLIGQPGSGKTTLLQAALAGLDCFLAPRPFAHIVYAHGVQIGAMRDTFGGTDALPLNVQPVVTDWLKTCPYDTILAEGDRLANARFFEAVRAMGWVLTVAYLWTPDDMAAWRRQQRGSAQNPAWVKGRITKVRRLAYTYATADWTLDGGLPTDALACQLQTHPVLRRLTGKGSLHAVHVP